MPSDRCDAVVGSLISSLDDEPDEAVEEAWGVEIARLLAEIDWG